MSGHIDKYILHVQMQRTFYIHVTMIISDDLHIASKSSNGDNDYAAAAADDNDDAKPSSKSDME